MAKLNYQPEQASTTRDRSWSTKRFAIGLALGVSISLILTVLFKWAKIEKDTEPTLLALIRFGSDFIAKAFLAGTVIVNMGLIDFPVGVLVTLLFANTCLMSIVWGLIGG
ncbi:MAG: hypothetical protein QM770_02675 [Tepidisphaeraceae bacterium]